MGGFIGFLVWALIIFNVFKKITGTNKTTTRQSGSNNVNRIASNPTVQKAVKSAKESASVFTGETHSRPHSDSANGRQESKWVADTVETRPVYQSTENHDSDVHKFTFGDNNKPSAGRLYPGDTVPVGYNVTRCSYCGADNLTKGDPCRYACYFCREEL